MVNNSTQRYIDIEKGTDFLSGILTETPVSVINGINEPIGQVEIDIDLDIEKRIAQLQESRLEGNLEKKIDLSIDPGSLKKTLRIF